MRLPCTWQCTCVHLQVYVRTLPCVRVCTAKCTTESPRKTIGDVRKMYWEKATSYSLCMLENHRFHLIERAGAALGAVEI